MVHFAVIRFDGASGACQVSFFYRGRVDLNLVHRISAMAIVMAMAVLQCQ